MPEPTPRLLPAGNGRPCRFGWWPRLRRNDGGQALAEFAMVIPLFMLMFFTIVDFGRAFYTWLVVTNAAREGARVGAVQGDTNAITTRVNTAIGSLDQSKLTIQLTNVRGARGSTVSVALTYDFDYVTPIGSIVSLFGSSLREPTIAASSSMRLE